MAIKPYLQLVRLPNLFTAAADSLAGWLLTRGSFGQPGRWLPLLGASIAIYAAGVVLNDVFDFKVDVRERPGRPLPSGRVSKRLAAWLGGVLLALGPVLAAASSSLASFGVALVLASCVLAYDGGVKRTPLGPELMGVCRGLNVLLGMSQSEQLGGPSGWLVAGSLALFVTGVTWISRSETETGHTRGLFAGVALQNLAIIGLLAAASPRGPLSWNGPERSITAAIGGLLVLVLVAGIVNRADARALRQPIPELIQKAVKTGILSLVWLNVGMVAAVRGPALAIFVALLWIPAFVLGRWLYST
jgi:4-hydroxybenzoate polyprenyltransferase